MNESEAMEVHCSCVSFTPVDAEDANTVPTARTAQEGGVSNLARRSVCAHTHGNTPPPPTMPPESGIWKKELISGLEKPQNETDQPFKDCHTVACVTHACTA